METMKNGKGAGAQAICRRIFLLAVLFSLAACRFPLETAPKTAETPGTEVLEPADHLAVVPQDTPAGRTYRVIEKFAQDGRFFVSVKDPPGDGGHLVQVEIKDKTVWEAVNKEGFITFGKSWQVTEIDGKGIEEIMRGDAK